MAKVRVTEALQNRAISYFQNWISLNPGHGKLTSEDLAGIILHAVVSERIEALTEFADAVKVVPHTFLGAANSYGVSLSDLQAVLVALRDSSFSEVYEPKGNA